MFKLCVWGKHEWSMQSFTSGLGNIKTHCLLSHVWHLYRRSEWYPRSEENPLSPDLIEGLMIYPVWRINQSEARTGTVSHRHRIDVADLSSLSLSNPWPSDGGQMAIIIINNSHLRKMVKTLIMNKHNEATHSMLIQYIRLPNVFPALLKAP